jgi:AraC-like DNA-binding protein
MDETQAINEGNKLLTYLLECISRGKCNDIEIEFDNLRYKELGRLTIGNDIIVARSAFEYVLPQVVRAGINGGMSWRAANELYFYFVKKSKRFTTVSEIMELLKKIFFDFAQNTALLKDDKKFSSMVRQCRIYIDEHIYEETLSVKSIAEALNISSGYLSHIFKTETGESILTYIRCKKISEAIWLLKNTSASVTAIYAKLNYCSQSYFTHVFRKETGMTPLSYRSKGVC